MVFFRRLVFFSIIALFISGCGGCSEIAGAGEECDAELEQPCENDEVDLVCTLDIDDEMRCLHPTGAVCDVEEDPGFCAPDTQCQSVDEEEPRCLITESSQCDPDEDYCGEGLVCAELESGDYECHQEVIVQGAVFDAESLDAIESAHVIAFDGERRALSDIAITDAEGHYELNIPAVRNADGEPVQQFFQLRGSAQDYQTFPGGIREAQPIDASTHDDVDGRWIIDTTQTDIALIELLADEQGHPQISGVVDIEDGLGGVLVIAEPEGVDHSAQASPTGFSAVSGLDGAFTIFNVPPDEYEVRGYLADYQIDPEAVSVDDADIDDLLLRRSSEGTQDVTGNLQIVRTDGETSVLLMAASTFDEQTARGEAPAGLRAPKTGPGNIDGSWTIEGVPAGQYVAVAAFENDDLVRSLDQGIAGTDLIYFDVPAEGGEMEIGESFKVTEALETISPGTDGPEGLSERPTLTWGRIANADWYDVVVFDAFGNIVFEEDDIEHSGGQQEYTAEYDGPFEPGMYYQFRATSHRMDSAQTSTEFLRGVFYHE